MHISTIQRTNIGSQLRHIVPLVLTLCLFTSCNFGAKPVDPQRAVGKDSLPGSNLRQDTQKEAKEIPPSGSNLEQAAQGGVAGDSPPGSTPASVDPNRVRRFCTKHQKEIFRLSKNWLEVLREQIAAGKSPEEVYPLIKERLDDPKKIFERSAKISLLTDCVRYGQVNAEAMAGKDAVVVLGNTGAGKSTFINYLAGCQLEKKCVEVQLEPILEVRGTSSGGRRDEVAPIGHEASQTFMPHIVAVGDQVYCDCPGFIDDRGVEIRIANAVNIKQALSKAQSLRMVVLVNYYSLLANRDNDFQNLLRTLQDLFGSKAPIEEHQGSLLLGISQCPDNMTREKLWADLPKHIPQSLLFLKDRLFIFDPLSPNESGDNEGWNLKRCLDDLDKLTKIQKPSSILSVPLAAEEVYDLRSLVEAMEEEIVALLVKKDLNAAFEKYCHLAKISVIDHQTIWSLLSSTWGSILSWVQQQENEFCLKYTKDQFEEAENHLGFLQEVANVFSLDASEIDPESLGNDLAKAHQSFVEEQEERAALQTKVSSLQKEIEKQQKPQR